MDSLSWGVRIGSAAFALGLGLGVAASPGVAVADDSDSSSSTQAASSGAAGPRTTGMSGRAGAKAAARDARSPRRDSQAKPAAARQPESISPGTQDNSKMPDTSERSVQQVPAPRPVSVPRSVPQPVPPAAQAADQAVPKLAAPTGGIVSGFLTALGLGEPAARTGIPTTPMEFFSAALAVVRREVEKVLNLRSPGAPVQTALAMPAAAALPGTTTTVTWAWGTNPVIDFNPATDKLDFGWMTSKQFTVTETGGSTVISVVDNNHSYTLKGVTLNQMQASNIVAKDASTVSKWGSLLNGAQTSSPSISVSDASKAEGNSGSSNIAFTVSLSKASSAPVTVKYATANGTATAGQDFTASSGTVTFAPGVTSQTINVAVTGDGAVEADEKFTVTLSSPSGATISRATATGTITNDDVAPPTVSIANASVNEGNSATTKMGFTVTLSKASTTPVTVKYATANGTATAGQDYTATSGTLTFAPGTTSQVVNVVVLGDSTVESNETFTVTLSNVSGATIGTATATGTIVNDDVAPTLPTVSIANASVIEGNSGSSNMGFTVTLSKASTAPITVNYATANGTALAGQDYTAASGTITFAPGVVSQIINVGVSGDTTVESTETFTVTLSNASGGTISGAAAVGSILNDDAGTTGPGGTTVPGGTTAQWGNTFFAPYIDMAGWPVPNLLQMSKDTGATLMTLGFLQVDPKGNPAWGGYNVLEPNSTDEQAKAINQSIANFRAAGGDVMISFGGAAGTSMAEYYASKGLSAQGLADAYISVVDTYGVDHVDFDVEGAAIGNRKAVDLNNQALKLLQQARPNLKVWYTLPVLPTGLTADGVYVVESALKAGVNVAGVNVMAMDYGPAAPTSGPNAQTMGTYAIRSAESTYSQMSTLYAKYGKSFGWNQIGVTPMLGVNDIPGEVFTVADAQALENFARTKGIGMLSLWSLERDYPGTIGQATHNASGISDPAGSFSGVFNDYGTINTVDYANTKPTTGTNPVGGGSNPGSGSVTPVTPVTGGPRTTVTWSWGTNPVLSFNPATDTLDFVWMHADQFTVTEKNGSVVISVVDNNHSYTLQGVKLSQLQMGNIVAKDEGTLAKWQALIGAAKAA